MNFPKNLLLATFFPACVLATPAAADAGDADEKTTAVHFWQFSECVAKRNSWQVEQLLAADNNSDQRKAASKKLAAKNNNCIPNGSQLRMSGKLFRSALAGAYIQRKYNDKPMPDFSSVATLYTIDSAPDDSSSKRLLRLGLLQFAECVARMAPDRVLGLFATQPFSEDETAAFDSLQPEMGHCLPVENGTKLGFTRLELRTLLGRVTYELDSNLSDNIDPPEVAETQN